MTEKKREERNFLILGAQLRAVTGAAAAPLFAQTIAALLLVVVLAGKASDVALLAWLLLICAILIGRFVYSRKFRRAKVEGSALEAWGKGLTLCMALNGMVWGLAAAVFYLPSDAPTQALLTSVLIGLSAGTITVSTPHLPANVSFITLMLLPLVVQTARVADDLYLITASLIGVYLGYLLYSARNMNGLLTTSLRMRFEHLDLIEALKAEKAAAEAARQAAEKANRTKSQFLAAASHDLRQPLHALGLFAAALDPRITAPAERQIVAKINQAVDALEALFNELLDISKLDAGVVTPARASFPLQQVFDRINGEYAPLAAEKGLRFKVMPSKVIVHSDPTLLERVLGNLVSNAIRYTSRGGMLMGARRVAGGFRIEVWDTGVGIAAPQQEKIFEEFYQIGNTERDRSKGLGLGLAIVHRLTELLDHRLTLHSRPGKGSVFGVSVPAGTLLREEPLVTDDLVTGGLLKGHFVLLIDDEQSVREGMEMLLREWGCDVLTSSSLAEAQQGLRKMGRRPDVIIADFRLREGVTGAEAIRALHHEYGANIPAILVTGDTAPDRLAEAQASGYHLLHKPVPPTRLRVLIGHMLDRRKASR